MTASNVICVTLPFPSTCPHHSAGCIPFSWLHLWILSFLVVHRKDYSRSESHKNHLFNALWMRRASENFKWEDLQTNEKHQSPKFQIWRQIWTYVVSIFCHITKSFVAKLWRLNFETFSFSLLDSYDTWVCSSAWSLFPKRNVAELFNIVKDYCVCQNINLGCYLFIKIGCFMAWHRTKNDWSDWDIDQKARR